MATSPNLDRNKALEALLYVANKYSRLYWVVKALFYADKAHLQRYGRLISGDWYVRMPWGPVPSTAYDMVKTARGDKGSKPDSRVSSSLAAHGRLLVPKRLANLDFLSQSEVECLDAGIAEVQPLTFEELKQWTHDEPAYIEAKPGKPLSLETLVRSLPEGDMTWAYVADC